MNKSSLGFAGRIFIIAFAVVGIFLALADWVSIPSIYGLGTYRDSYTLSEVADVLRNINRLADEEAIEFLSIILKIVPIILVIELAATALCAIMNWNVKKTARSAAGSCTLSAVLFFILLFFVKTEIESNFGYREFIFTPTFAPILLVASSVLVILFSPSSDKKTPAPSTAGRFCANCGSPIPGGAVFCPGCGTRVEVVGKPSPASLYARQKNEEKTLQNGGWKCAKCGRVNTHLTGTCGCGNSKYSQ